VTAAVVTPPPHDPRAVAGCGCTVARTGSDGAAGLTLLIGAAAWLRSARRRGRARAR
jgi:MYXO-CTERM domain-containing protein